MTDVSLHAAATDTPARRRPPAARSSRWRRWWRRRPINRALVAAHRWPSLILGLFLVVECTSGAVLLYHGDLYRATSSSLYRHTGSTTPIAAEQAIDTVARAHPSFPASWVAHDDGVYVVGDAAYQRLYFVDPGTGAINGSDNTDDGFLGWLVNLHDCAFTCEGYPWYSSWLAGPVWANGPTFLTGVTWGGMALGVLGALLILLVLTSLKIWWPGLRRLRSRFTVRRGKGRFARDFDLHNVVGAVALPFLLMWGVTGAAFEFPGVEQAWVTITGGDARPEPTFALTPDKAAARDPAITFDTAVRTALDRVPGTAAFVGRPTKDAPYWEIDIDSGYGSAKYRAIYHSDAYVLVDAHDAGHVKVIGDGSGAPAANRFYDKYLEPAHFGWQVNGWWRSIWFVLGLAPLVLFVTGVSTWLHRRGVQRRRARALGSGA